jgi:hypothetical protein
MGHEQMLMANDKSDPANPVHPLKSQSRMVSFESCDIWFCGDKVVVDSRVPLPDLKLREFARPRILFEDASYYVSEKSQSSGKPAVHRYVLTRWPKNDESITRTIVLNEDYFQELRVERRRARLESMAFKALVDLLPFPGLPVVASETGAQPNRIRVARDQQPVNVYGLSDRILVWRVSRDLRVRRKNGSNHAAGGHGGVHD